MLVLAYYCVRAALNNLTDFFKWTVHARLLGATTYLVLVLLDVAPTAVLGFALMDFLGALWTRKALIAAERGSL